MSQEQNARRSYCPLNVALEILGDRWTLLILRDLLFKKHTRFRDLLAGGEGIATNVLTDRLTMLQAQGLIVGARSEEDARVMIYKPTPKGLDLLPIMIEMILWADQYEETTAPLKMIRRLKHQRQAFIREVRSRFE